MAVNNPYGFDIRLNAELLTLLVRMGVHPKVFPDFMHTSVRMPIVPCDNYSWRKGWATRWAGAPHLNQAQSDETISSRLDSREPKQ
ncbi:hypothetical protein Bca52824_064347 [Brassica carinata]|uniref:Uncharacterized protein n=1 Tax=Brassica carinata TaxID=52824 RepID=A0A8X7U8I6_BRACI|nr:hypothetical protein Bca52824_064347 [Brassica carinata]